MLLLILTKIYISYDMNPHGTSFCDIFSAGNIGVLNLLGQLNFHIKRKGKDKMKKIWRFFGVIAFGIIFCVGCGDGQADGLSGVQPAEAEGVSAESNTDAESQENSPDMPQNDTVDGLNKDILAASAGTTVTQTIETSVGGVISIDAQVDVDGINRVSRYRYIPLQFTEDSRKTLLGKWFAAESWDVNEAALYNANEEKWEFTTPLGKDCIYQVIRSENPEEQILNVEVVSARLDYTGENILSPVRVTPEFINIAEEILLVDEVTAGRTPNEIQQIGQIIIQTVAGMDAYSCSYMHVCEESGGHRYVKAVFKQTVDGMPVTAWHDFTTITAEHDVYPTRGWGSLFSMEEIGLNKPILTPEEAAAAVQEHIDSVQIQDIQMYVTKISLEYLVVGASEIVPVWRFWIGNDEMERIMTCEQILAINAVNGELIWENRGAFTE